MKRIFTTLLSLSLLVCFAISGANAQVVWGANGEGEFDGGLGDWYTIAADSADVWTYEADATSNVIRQAMIQSASASNGVAHMDLSGLTCAIIDCANAGPPPYPQHTAILASPVMDLTGSMTPVLKYTQLLDDLNGDANGGFFILLSDDAGATWGDTIRLAIVNETNGSVQNTEELSFPIDFLANKPNATIGFSVVLADFYSWMIDDVQVVNETISDGVVPEGWFTTAPNWRTPASQVDLVPLMADVESVGNVGVENAVLNARIDGPSGLEYEGSLEYGNLEPTTNYWNVVWDEFYTMSDEEGMYTISYELVSDSEDADPSNNSVSANFMVGGNTFNKVIPESEAGSNYLVGLAPGGGNVYNSYANAYYIPNGEGYQATTISTGFEFTSNAEIQPATVVAHLYLWIDDGDGIAAATNEKFLVASGEYFIDPDEVNFFELRNIDIELTPDGAETLELAPNSQYIATVHVNPLTPEDFTDPIRQLGLFVDSNRDFSYGPMQFAFENSGTQVRRYGSMWAPDGVDGTPSDNLNRTLTSGITTQATWYIPLEIAIYSDADDINNNLNVSVYPNPADDYVSVELDLAEVSDIVNVSIVNLEGKVVTTTDRQNLQNGVIKLDVQNLNAGVYFANISTSEGTISKRIIIQ